MGHYRRQDTTSNMSIFFIFVLCYLILHWLLSLVVDFTGKTNNSEIMRCVIVTVLMYHKPRS